jgi:phage terminase Nu1 subunit (DNA packaging protein)
MTKPAEPILSAVNAATLGKVLGLSRGTIANLSTDGVLPKSARRRYDLPSCVQAFLRHKMLQAGAGDLATQSLVAERGRLARLKADAAEREARVEAGELVDVADVETAWLAVAHAAYARLLVIPTKVSPRVITMKTAGEAQALLQKELYAALSGLAAAPAL